MARGFATQFRLSSVLKSFQIMFQILLHSIKGPYSTLELFDRVSHCVRLGEGVSANCCTGAGLRPGLVG